jgi:hypothetical protein
MKKVLLAVIGLATTSAVLGQGVVYYRQLPPQTMFAQQSAGATAMFTPHRIQPPPPPMYWQAPPVYRAPAPVFINPNAGATAMYPRPLTTPQYYYYRR